MLFLNITCPNTNKKEVIRIDQIDSMLQGGLRFGLEDKEITTISLRNGCSIDVSEDIDTIMGRIENAYLDD